MGADNLMFVFFFSSRRRHTRSWRDWSSDVCSSDLLNLGSSSLKAALYEMGPPERVVAVARAERIGRAGSRLRLADANGVALLDQSGDLPDFDAAVQALFAALAQQGLDAGLAAVGHRAQRPARARDLHRRQPRGGPRRADRRGPDDRQTYLPPVGGARRRRCTDLI